MTRTATWLPPVDGWDTTSQGALPYGWERAMDDAGKPYYIK